MAGKMSVVALTATLICTERILTMSGGKSLEELTDVKDAGVMATGLLSVMHAQRFWSATRAAGKGIHRLSAMRERTCLILTVNSKSLTRTRRVSKIRVVCSSRRLGISAPSLDITYSVLDGRGVISY